MVVYYLGLIAFAGAAGHRAQPGAASAGAPTVHVLRHERLRPLPRAASPGSASTGGWRRCAAGARLTSPGARRGSTAFEARLRCRSRGRASPRRCWPGCRPRSRWRSWSVRRLHLLQHQRAQPLPSPTKHAGARRRRGTSASTRPRWTKLPQPNVSSAVTWRSTSSPRSGGVAARRAPTGWRTRRRSRCRSLLREPGSRRDDRCARAGARGGTTQTSPRRASWACTPSPWPSRSLPGARTRPLEFDLELHADPGSSNGAADTGRGGQRHLLQQLNGCPSIGYHGRASWPTTSDRKEHGLPPASERMPELRRPQGPAAQLHLATTRTG